MSWVCVLVSVIPQLICRTAGPRQYFAGIAFLREADGSFRAVVAGHPAIQRISAAGEVLSRVGIGSYPAGIKEGTRWVEETGRLLPGETLLFYSDGLYENPDARGVPFGEERIAAVVRRKAGASAEALVAGLASEASLFWGRRPVEDDVTVLAIRRA
jgi:sigma-B regulation protein RsbU (phosphoserine phosphatase)